MKATGFLLMRTFGQFFLGVNTMKYLDIFLPSQPRKKKSVVVYSIILVINKNGVGPNRGKKS